eukprot:CAMPEP_0196722992 /NCGR_PEP_ID=MMETSP1091-20130531/5202_1 /TAXON_ID=302021 /ORGANISM="Rhodomonas sp., Strain CCMP768" /LENGTH=321 /DNA_ID=CAMNT_0042064811 /DNA_START=11 /DNA_END=976 /DNA_ORIENTATION=+
MAVEVKNVNGTKGLEDSIKDAKDVDAALSLLEKLRAGAQISDSAHESLIQVLTSMTKDSKVDAPAPKTEAKSLKPDSHPAMPDQKMPLESEKVPCEPTFPVPTRGASERPFKHPSSKSQQLTSEEAAEIYSMRPEIAKGTSLRRGCMIKSKLIAPRYGVSPKTIRDIWHGRTWISTTRPLWTEEEVAQRSKGSSVSDEEERNEHSPNSNSVTPPPFSPHSEFAALNALQQQALLSNALLHNPAMATLPFPFADMNPQHLEEVRRHQLAMLGLLSPGFTGLTPSMMLGGQSSSFGMGPHASSLSLPRPAMSAGKKKKKMVRA